MRPPAAPPDTLVQSLLVDPEGTTAGYRISSGGGYHSRTRERGWSEGRRLTPEQVAAIERAIGDSGFDALEDRYERRSHEHEPSTLWFQVARPEGLRTVEVVGGARVPALERLTARLTEIVGSA